MLVQKKIHTKMTVIVTMCTSLTIVTRGGCVESCVCVIRYCFESVVHWFRVKRITIDRIGGCYFEWFVDNHI